MKIAIAGILNKPITSNSLGGTETFTYNLVNNLVQRGHEVTLFARSDSGTKANQISICEEKDIRGVVESGIETRFLYHLLQSLEITKKSEEFDIIHNNYYDSFFLTPFSNWMKCPLVTTIHNDFLQFENMKRFFKETHRSGSDAFVFVSKKARNLAGDPTDSHVIYNGVDIADYKYESSKTEDYIFWLSRVVPPKGASEAVKIALGAGRKIIMAGKTADAPEGKQYFKEHVEKFIGKNVEFVSTPLQAEKLKLYSRAKMFLFPIQWEEPFGLVVVEANACETPVVAYARGAMPELIKDGVTGFIVNSSEQDKRGDWVVKKTGIEGMVEAVKKIYDMPEEEYHKMRQNCRKHVEENFTVEKMVDGYEKVYQQVIEDWKKGKQ